MSDTARPRSSKQPPRNALEPGLPSVLDELLAAVASDYNAEVDVTVRPDLERAQRKGVPEVILSDRKRPADVISAAHLFVERTGRALLSRIDQSLTERVRAEFRECHLEHHTAARMLVVKRPDFVTPVAVGGVGVLCAGTSDVPVAEEAAVMAAEMGCRVETAYDVGVAGLHRLSEPLGRMLSNGVDAIVVAAGMDGALPSVVAGLVDVPVIGLPTSVGYGAGGQGLAALLSMLQTCSPGLSVVNIDNGIGAGACAGLIAIRAARIANRSVS